MELQVPADANVASAHTEVSETENVLTQYASDVISPIKNTVFITLIMFPGCYRDLLKLPQK